ncbi:MAG: TrkH family potassium uptake protein [Caulobacterales bacterium]|nr:TrkH family potassium uptake protein [Caulobacterales bacterium]
MRELQPVLVVTGIMLVGLAAFMFPPMLLDYYAGQTTWLAFAWASGAAAFTGGALSITARGRIEQLSVRAAFVLTVVSWLTLTAFAAIPFALAGLGLTLADAFFEAMSGLTTTGSTVIRGLDTKPQGLLLWRAILQWIGGVGIVVTAIAVLPMLGVGGMQLFRLESSDASEKLLPRATQIAGLIAVIYLVLTVICAAVYALLGLSPFHAIAHATTTIATGGFSTSDGSMGTYMQNGADIAAIVFMLAGSLPFGLYMLALRGDMRGVLRDSQAQTFLVLVLVLVAAMTTYLVLNPVPATEGRELRMAAFNVVSILTGTGYATTDYVQWGPFAIAFFFCLTFVGGCAGSTSCGLKIFRFQVAAIALRAYLTEMIRPHHVAPYRYNRRKLTDETVYSVLSFFFLFLATFAALALALAALGLDTVTALSAAATAVANVGPGLGDRIGPAGVFADLPDAAKWLLALGMLIGRLEVFTVLVLFAPSFWRD